MIKINKVILMGRLTKEPDIKYTQTTNKMVVKFTLAVKRRFAKGNEQQADFFNIIAWNKTGEFVSKYFKKGQQVGVIGRLNTRDYEDKDKKKIYVTEVIAEEVYFADSNKNENKVETPADIDFNEFTPNFNMFEEDNDELPF